MPFKDKEKQKEAMRLIMRKRRQGITSGITKGITSVIPAPSEAPKTPHVDPKAIYIQPLPLTRTHRFEITAPLATPTSPALLSNVTVRHRGNGGRIVYAEVKLEHSVIEIHRRKVRIYSTRELEGLDEAHINGMKDALKAACRFRGLTIAKEADWKVGEWSHTTMEDKALNEALAPLGIKGVGDNNYNIFKDDGSHPDQVETAGKENWTGTNLLYHVLFRLPIENAEAFRKYGENIEQHLSVLTKMGDGIDRLTAAVGKLERKPPTTKDRLGKRQWGQGWRTDEHG